MNDMTAPKRQQAQLNNASDTV